MGLFTKLANETSKELRSHGGMVLMIISKSMAEVKTD